MSKSAGVKFPITNRIWSIVTDLGGRGLVAIQATHGPLQHMQLREFTYYHCKEQNHLDIKGPFGYR